MSPRQRILTGITTTGTPHLGNYVGAIRPAIAASRRDDVESFYFLADYHALVKCDEPARVARSRLEIAATWLALGLDTERAFFYRQSDIPEIPELTWLLTCICAKGLLNRAHAYKAAVDRNVADGEDPDAGINAGLYLYPVLMAADILVFNAHRVPVGRDQIQHIEMARDIAQRFNHLYGGAYRGVTGVDADPFVLPDVVIEENVATLPGLDGRKMSKSYDNTIPLWLPREELRKAILGVVTDSLRPGEPKDPDTSNLFALYRAFASDAEAAAMREAFAAGIAWGEAKQQVFERIDAELAAPRAKYEKLIVDPAAIEDILLDGARKARERSTPLLEALRDAIGLGALREPAKPPPQHVGPSRIDAGMFPAPTLTATFKSYREADGRFFFKLVRPNDIVLLQSHGFDSPKEAGRLVAALVDAGAVADALPAGDEPATFVLRDAHGAEYARGLVPLAEVNAALAALREDKLARQKS